MLKKDYNFTNKKVVEKELSEFTILFLERLEKYRDITKNSMVIGASSVLRGVDIFEKLFIDINPSFMSEDDIEILFYKLNSSIVSCEYAIQNINSYVRLGIQDCILILWNLSKTCKYKRVKER